MRCPLVLLLMVPLIGAAAPALPASRPSPRALLGNWESACMPIGKGGRHGFTTRLTFTRTTLVATAQIYAHSDCDVPTVRNDYSGTFGNMRTDGDGTIAFDQVAGAITLTANHPEVVTIYNADSPGSGCGMGGGWVLNVPRAVNGRTCAPWTYPAVGTRLYERAWVTGDELRIGSFPYAWDNISPDKRPTAPGMLIFHRAAEKS